MASLESKIRSKFKDELRPSIAFVGNLKLYYNQYPHCVTLICPYDPRYGINTEQSHTMHRFRSAFYALKRSIKRKLKSHKHTTRIEFDRMRIYTTDPLELVDFISKSMILENYGIETMGGTICRIELMDDACQAKLKEPVTDSIKTKNVMAKQLPWKKYRYRVHWAAMSRDKRQIGLDNLQAIAVQLRNFEQIRMSDSVINEIMGRNYYTSWQSTYFYAEDLDWLPIICLIDGRFIKKIERFQTEYELRQEQGLI